MDRRIDDGETTSARPDQRSNATPTGDVAERWLRRASGDWDGERHDAAGCVTAAQAYLHPPSIAFRATVPAAGRPAGAGRGGAMGPFGWPLDPLRAAMLTGAPGLDGVVVPASPPSAFLGLTCCHAYYARPNRDHRPCAHAHVDLLVCRERGAGSPEVYSVRVVNVDLPRCRHAEAFAESDALWPSYAAAAAAGVAVARERWGNAIAVVHLTPAPVIPDDRRP